MNEGGPVPSTVMPSPIDDTYRTRGVRPLRALLLHLLILSVAVAAAFITVFILPVAAADAPKIFTPSQWQAIATGPGVVEIELGRDYWLRAQSDANVGGNAWVSLP